MAIYVGSCPDYSYSNGLYDHKFLGGSVPLLTQIHLQSDLQLLKYLDQEGIPYKFIVMVADIEATDPIFCNKFTQGDEEKFLNLCNSSVSNTQILISQISDSFNFSGDLTSSSFFREFGRREFLEIQEAYQEVLSVRFDKDSSFRMRVFDDILRRMSLYQKMYDGILPTEGQKREDFLVQRTIRTMAQYLTLGRFVANKTPHPTIICHPTRNIGMFNSRNKFLLPSDGSQPQSTIPIFEIKKKVY